MATRTLFERGGLGLHLHDEAPPEAVDLLVNTVWGTEGGVRYRHSHTLGRIGKQLNPQYLTLHKSDRLLGVLGFMQRKVQQPAGEVEAFYIRYLSMMSTFQRQSSEGAGSRRRSDGLIKRMVGRMLGKPSDLNVEAGMGPEAALFYAYVELDNERSLEMTQAMGFEPIGQFSTILFSRFKPKRSAMVQLLRPEDEATVRAHLRHFYRDHALFYDANAFREGPYYVCWDGGKIVAGFKANLCEWKVEEMAGWSGLMIMPKLPYLRDVFNPNGFRFFATEAMWHLPGYEMRLFDLLETALVDTERNTAMIWLDRRSPLDAVIRQGSLGLFHKLQADAPADIIARFINVPDHIKADIRNKPLYISSFDSV